MASVVYIVKIGKHVKIGFTTNLEARMKAFATSAVEVERLIAIPGDRALERKLHSLFSEIRIAREIFHHDGRIQNFIEHVEYGGLERGLQYLFEMTPAARKASVREDRRVREVKARESKAALNAHFASLVADRKQRLGW